MQAWMKAQNDYSRTVLKQIPGRPKIRERLRELDQSVPHQVSNVRRLPGDLYFDQKLVVGKDDVPKLYVRHGFRRRLRAASQSCYV